MDWIRSTGTLIYDPVGRFDRSRKPDPWWALLICDNEIIRYYNYWLLKQGIYNIQGESSVHGSHISVIKGEKPTNPELWKKYHKKQIEFSYSNEVFSNDTYWWLLVKSDEIEHIRIELGLPPKANMNFHLTIGRKKY
jgi:hypothetical protein